MSKVRIGVDIGNSDLKLAVRTGSSIKTLMLRLPENMVRDGRVQKLNIMGDFLKSARKEYGLPWRAECAVVLPDTMGLFRRMNLPYMTIAQLHLNLPYEFRDYISAVGDSYYYDYALESILKDQDGKPESMDLMAAAVPKPTIQEYMDLFKMAGLKLRVILPQEMVYVNLLREHLKSCPEDMERETCIVDIGYESTRVHIFSGASFRASRSIEIGCAHIYAAIARSLNGDSNIEDIHKLTDFNQELSLPACIEVYHQIAIEIMKAVNFYRFNNSDSVLNDIIFAGGGSFIAPLVEDITETVGLTFRNIGELMLPGLDKEDAQCILAVGLVSETEVGSRA